MDTEGSEGALDAAHCRHEVEPGVGLCAADDFVAYKEVADEGVRVEGYDVVVHPLVGECFVGGDVGDYFVGDHDGDLEGGVLEGVEDPWVGVVDFDALGLEGLYELHGFPWRWKVVT